jgi:hypothetical protein
VADFHHAQVNLARMNAPLDSAEMADFVARIAEHESRQSGPTKPRPTRRCC